MPNLSMFYGIIIMILANWTLLQNGQAPYKIKPLE